MAEPAEELGDGPSPRSCSEDEPWLVLGPHFGGVEKLQASTTGDHLAAVDSRGNIWLWDLEAEAPVVHIDQRDHVSRMALSPIGEHIAVSTRMNHLEIWSTEDPSEPVRPSAADKRLLRLHFFPAGDRLWTLDESHRLQLWHVDGELQAALDLTPGLNDYQELDAGTGALLSPDGKRFVVLRDSAVTLLDAGTLQRQAKLTIGRQQLADISDDSRWLAVLSPSGELRMVDLVERRVVSNTPLPRGDFLHLAMSADREQLVLLAQDKRPYLWTLATRKLLALEHEDREISKIVSSRNGELLAGVVRLDHHALIWSRRDSKLLARFAGHRTRLRDAAWVLDDRFLATASDAYVRLWCTETFATR